MNSDKEFSKGILDCRSKKGANESIIDPDICHAIESDFKLPKEMVDEVLEIFYRYQLHPGKVFPQQEPSPDGYFFHKGKRYRAAKPPLFNSMSRRWYQKFLDIYWNGNVFVIGQGSGFYSTDFLHLLPDYLFFKIKRVELAFTIRDLDGGMYLAHPLKSSRIQSLGLDPAEVSRFNVDLQTEWFRKFLIISAMRLEELKLDFSEAYTIDGEFQGLNLARDLLRHFENKPARLIIAAPNRKLKKLLHSIFRTI